MKTESLSKMMALISMQKQYVTPSARATIEEAEHELAVIQNGEDGDRIVSGEGKTEGPEPVIERCEDCRYSAAHHSTGYACRRFPPVCGENFSTRYPCVRGSWHCGEFKPPEGKE